MTEKKTSLELQAALEAIGEKISGYIKNVENWVSNPTLTESHKPDGWEQERNTKLSTINLLLETIELRLNKEQISEEQANIIKKKVREIEEQIKTVELPPA
jgi:hypothetical protein